MAKERNSRMPSGVLPALGEPSQAVVKSGRRAPGEDDAGGTGGGTEAAVAGGQPDVEEPDASECVERFESTDAAGRAGARAASAASGADAELVGRARGGDEAAYEALVVRYEARVRRLAFSFVRDEGLAEDIAQDAFVQALRRLASLQDADSFRSWLFSIVANRARDEIRRRSRFVDLADEGGTDSVVQWRVAEPPAARELRPYLAAALAELPDRYRVPLLLKEIEGMTYAEIARTLSIPIGTAQIRIHRARLRLRRHLEELGVEGAAP